MKKFLLLIAVLFLVACQSEPEYEDYFDDYTEFDEQVRQQIYAYYGDMFFYDKDLQVKSRLDDEFKDGFGDVFGGNILGVKKLNEDLYQVDFVVFRDGPMHYTHEVTLLKFHEDESDFSFEEVYKAELEFREPMLIFSLDSPSGDYFVRQYKNLVPVDFYTIEDVEVPAFLGRYDLYLDNVVTGEKTLMDFSFDKFSTNQPFEFGEFSEDEKFFAYFEWDLGRFPYRYDIENLKRISLGF